MVTADYLRELSEKDFIAHYKRHNDRYEQLKTKHSRIKSRLDHLYRSNGSRSKAKALQKELDKILFEWTQFTEVNDLYKAELDIREWKWSDWYMKNTQKKVRGNRK